MSLGFVFPGQGSQHVGMGLDLFEQVPEARAVFDQANEQLGFALSELCFSGPEEKLTDTVNQQPALFVTSLAAWHALKGRDWPPADYLAGHSLGEFSALVAAGSLDFSAGLALVRRRGELMKAAGEKEPGGMAAILALDVRDPGGDLTAGYRTGTGGHCGTRRTRRRYGAGRQPARTRTGAWPGPGRRYE